MTDNKQTLEQAMAAICAAHDLANFEINFSAMTETYSVSCFWDDGDNREVATDYNCHTTIAAALSGSLAKMKKQRTPPEQDIRALPAFEVQS